MSEGTRDQIDAFLRLRRLAFIGVSRSPHAFSRSLFDEFQRRGYDAVPVNPHADSVAGVPCVARIQDVAPPAEGAMVTTQREVTPQILRDCVEAGTRNVWLIGRAAGPEALQIARAEGLTLISGYCPFLFLPGMPWFHRIHTAIARLTGAYPA